VNRIIYIVGVVVIVIVVMDQLMLRKK